MALLWIEGFEGIGSNTSNAQAELPLKYTVSNNGPTFIPKSGRVNGTSLSGVNFPSSQAIQTPTLANASTIIVGFAWKRASSFKAAHHMVDLLEGSNLGVNLRQKTNGEYEVYMNTTLLGTTSGGSIADNTWAYFELKVVTHNSAGTVDLLINGVSQLSLSSQDTQPGSNAYVNSVRFLWANDYSSPSTDYTIFDDIYICDGTGSARNGFLGDSRVEAKYPSGAGSSTQWTPSTGSNYACVDENPSNGDTDYVEDSTSGHKDLYAYGAVASLAAIHGIQICTTAKGSGLSLKNHVKSGSTDHADSSVALTGSYAYVNTIIEQDPDTTADWDVADLDSAEFGAEVA